MRTVHIILNAHLDPVWLWPWTAGVDECLNTCYTMCNTLDRHPEIIFTRGEAWVYEQVRRHDPALFKRIVKHIKAGRWSVVGGWWIQPDCNLPGAENLNQQIKLGRAWFKQHLGLFPRIGYNVDSFGHSAALPDIMAAHGQDSYVFMRPMAHETKLTSRIFRWRGQPGGKIVNTFRIAHGYCTIFEPTLHHVEGALEDLPTGVTHTMCFLGVGDHGGGPNEHIIQWVKDNREAIPDARLEFSSPERFFKALVPQVKHLPLVTGELQMHAIGCYTAHRPVKLGVRRAENLLAQTTCALATAKPSERKAAAPIIAQAWESLCFNSFHDTLGGSCTHSAAKAADDQLAGVKASAETVLSETFRRRAHHLPVDPRQRIIAANYTSEKFTDFIEHEPWLEWTHWKPDWCLLDERNRMVPHQIIEPETLMPDTMRVLYPAEIKPGELHTVRIARKAKGKTFALQGPAPDFKLNLSKSGKGDLTTVSGEICPLPDLRLIEEKSDTWSHNIDRFAGPQLDHAHWSKPRLIETGPIRHLWRTEGRIGESRICADWRRYRRCDFYELRLRINWHEHHKMLRLSWSPGSSIMHRDDGISGGDLHRTSDGRELPLRDRTLLHLADDRRAGIVAPEVFGISGDGSSCHLTLLRSCPFAHHDPKILPATLEHYAWVDQGEHTFTLRFFPSGKVTAKELDHHALHLQQRPVIADLTRGMSHRPFKDEPAWPL
jgi:alpha-mannosidase|uniref:glycoside hydrolase family 38 N-terminal domain-containing protein n=1 Tax=Cephaloticoccus sp. TaxID=1985742 RepID=UPI00404B366F